MAVQLGSAMIKVKASPNVLVPRVADGEATFACANDLWAVGSVVLTGSRPATGWTLGFLQVEWIDTNWTYYRGQSDTDGSIFFQRARPPARPAVACRDVDPPGEIFYTSPMDLATVPSGAGLPITLRVDHSDQPQDRCDVVVTNSKTGKPNLLHEAQLEFLFCTVLTVRDPAMKYHHLSHFYWNVRWRARFEPTSFANPRAPWTVTPIVGGQGHSIGPVKSGGPNDHRFAKILTDPSVPACNAIAALYDSIPVGNLCRRESSVWTSFDVRR
jgi:hypothetical protein